MLASINPLLLVNLATSFLGFLFLLLIWRDVQKKKTAQDKGYLYASIAVLFWSVSALVDIICPSYWPAKTHEFCIYTLSTINNGFFLFSMYYFDFSPSWMRKSRTWLMRALVITCAGVIGLIFVFFFYTNWYQDLKHAALSPDILFSIFTTWILGKTFFRSFQGRGLPWISYLSVGILFIIALAQLLPLIDSWAKNNQELVLPLLIFSHQGLIIILITSVLGWIIERGEIPEVSEMKLVFDKIDSGKKKHLFVKITIDKDFANKEVEFTSALYLYFLKFAVRKKYKNAGLQHEEYYYENSSDRIIKRIREVKDEEDSKKSIANSSQDPIKSKVLGGWPFIFEKTQDGLKQLLVYPENIHISKDLIDQIQQEGFRFDGFPESKTQVDFIVKEFNDGQQKKGSRP